MRAGILTAIFIVWPLSVRAQEFLPLAAIESDLHNAIEGLEAFLAPSDAGRAVEYAGKALPPEVSPRFKDRPSSLSTLYRTQALLDYTRAGRLPEPSCSPAERRAKLIASSGDLFMVGGKPSPWMTLLLGPSAPEKGLEAALDEASAGGSAGEAEYARLRSRRARITAALADGRAEGATRAKFYCLRAEVHESLARANAAAPALTAASRALQSAPIAGVVAVARKTEGGLEVHGAGVIVDGKVLTDRRVLPEGLPRGLLAILREGTEPVEMTLERDDPAAGLALLKAAEPLKGGLELTEAAPAKDELVQAIGHSAGLGAWTRTKGLVTAVHGDAFQTDAAVDPAMAGGAVLSPEGRLAGLLVLRPVREGAEERDWPLAVGAPALKAWLAGGAGPEVASKPVELEHGGTSSLITASSSFRVHTQYGSHTMVCKANCGGGGSSSYSTGPSGAELMGRALGEAIGRGLRSLFRGRPKSAPVRPAPSRNAPSIVAPTPARELPPPPPPKPPLTPVKLVLTLEGAEAARGEAVELTARLDFTGEAGSRAGRTIAFAADPAELATFEPASAVTDHQGEARAVARLAAMEEVQSRFDALDAYESVRAGGAAPERVAGKARGPVDEVKERERRAGDALDAEAAKYPDEGDEPSAPTADERPRAATFGAQAVEFTATAGALSAVTRATVYDYRCPPGTAAKPLDPENAAPGEPARGDTAGKLNAAACREIEREAVKACGNDGDCVEAKKREQGWHSLGCDKLEGQKPVYDLGSPPTWVPKGRRAGMSFACVPSEPGSARARSGAYRQAAEDEDAAGSSGARAPVTAEGLIERVWAVLKPDGRWIGERKGDIIRVKGTLDDAVKLFERLAEGLSVGPHPELPVADRGGKMARQGKVAIGFRPVSNSGPPTVDVNIPNKRPFEVKFIHDP
jgi:hypothetical protein